MQHAPSPTPAAVPDSTLTDLRQLADDLAELTDATRECSRLARRMTPTERDRLWRVCRGATV